MNPAGFSSQNEPLQFDSEGLGRSQYFFFHLQIQAFGHLLNFSYLYIKTFIPLITYEWMNEWRKAAQGLLPYVYKDVIHTAPVFESPEDLTISRRDSRVFPLPFYSRELKKPKELPDLESKVANAKQTLNPAIQKRPVIGKSPTGNSDKSIQGTRLWIMFWWCWKITTKVKQVL